MTYEIKTDKEIPINQVGRWFKISGRNNINGMIHLTNDRGDHYHIPLYKYETIEINISEMIESNIVDFNPLYIEFHSDNPNIQEIKIEKAPVNPDPKPIL